MRVWPLLALSIALVPLTAAAQHAGHQHTPGAASEGHLRAQACLDEFDAVVADGRGFGMAFAADQNGYPGPMHVLELKDRLALSAEQEARVRALMQRCSPSRAEERAAPRRREAAARPLRGRRRR
jgi:Spy/CpxP family protein refolding chaperone